MIIKNKEVVNKRKTKGGGGRGMGPLKTGLSSSCGAKSMSKRSLVSDHQLTLSEHPAGGGGAACAGLEGEKGGNEKDQHRPYLSPKLHRAGLEGSPGKMHQPSSQRL